MSPRALRGSTTVAAILPVAVGLVIQAIAAYLTLILAGRLLGAAHFAGLAALYVLITSVSTGLFQPLEQEVARRLGRARETGAVDATLLRRALVLGLSLCGAVVAILLALYSPLVRLLGDQPQLLGALCVGLFGYVLCYVVRGGLSGRRRMRRYGLQLAVEGSFRLVALIGLALVGVHSTTAYGWLFALAPWIAVACSAVGLPRSFYREATAGSPGPALLAPMGLLLVSTLSAQLLIGAGPITAQLFSGPGEATQAGVFLAALVVMRVPVFLFTAVQPSMLPTMAAHVAAGRVAGFRLMLGRVLAGMGAVAALTTLATTTLGPWGLRLLFGPDFNLTWPVFLLMGVSVGLFLTSGVLGQAVLALGHHRLVAVGWVAGLVGLAIGINLSHDLVGRATLGLLVGAGVAGLTFAGLLWHSMRRWQPAVEPVLATS